MFLLSLIILISVAEKVDPYNPQPGGDLAPPFIFLPGDGSSHRLIATDSWTADEASEGQLSKPPEYSIDGQGLGQLIVGETDGCQPRSNQNRRLIRRGQACPAPPMKATGQDTKPETGQNTEENTRIWPSAQYPDDLPTVVVPNRPSIKADLEKCHHDKYNTPVCDQGEDSTPNFGSSTGEWALPNCVPCTCSSFFSYPKL